MGYQRLCRPDVRCKARALPNGLSAAMPPRGEVVLSGYAALL